MAQSQDGFDMQEYEATQDSGLTDVMPDTWLGHGRLVIHERGFSDKKRTFAGRLLERLAEKHPDKPTDMLAEKAAELADKKID